MKGYESVYVIGDTGWAADFSKNGYHLPTEAQWERAAAWDGAKHWTYGYTADFTGATRMNYQYSDSPLTFVNPFGFVDVPLTAPVGWFNGVNISPHGPISVDLSVSPVGCYDMSGNVREWCNDLYAADYYATSPANDPTGPAGSGSNHVWRGGSWALLQQECRTARRGSGENFLEGNQAGLRIAR
jgi:formylglycine-generating enzyme required for sulfatase activity